ncbi:MAG: esterase-like activity of phytase family protein [Proteobacteria bacterium]|nr:esterase-like activity of phytase family protein [Pseudomonadota bacterium]
MRAMVLIALVLTAASGAAAKPITIEARPVPLNADDPAENVVGALIYRGGLELTSKDPDFGGLSALGISSDGRRLVALSDRGFRFQARILYDERGRLVGLADADLGPMGGIDGAPLTDKEFADAESMAPGVEGEIVVAFERRHRLWRYVPGSPLPEPLPPPDELAGAPSNGGIEALALLDDGRLFALTEKYSSGEDVVGWISDRDGWSVLTLATDGGFDPTGAATLPGGDIVVVMRRFTLAGAGRARLIRIPVDQIRPGARLRGRTIAEIGPPLTFDNFEGVEARQGARGETLITILSDDNFNPFQRTLLMMFELKE